jgi:hypothetical protein
MLTFTIDDPTLDITTDTTKNQRTLTLTNSSGADQVLTGGVPVDESQIDSNGPSIFYVMFGTAISSAELQQMEISSAGWATQFYADIDGSWAVCPQTDITLMQGESVAFQITNLSIDGQPRPAQITIDYYNFGTVVDNFSQIKILIQNVPSGPANLTLTCQFTDNKVYTTLDSESPVYNQLSITLANPSQDQPVVGANTRWLPNAPLFTFSFLYGEAPGYGALTRPELSGFDMKVADQYQGLWSMSKQSQSSGAYFLLQPNADTNHEVLGVHDASAVELVITGLVTDLPVGDAPDPTYMYIQHANIPNYNDGYFSVLLLKVAGPGITSFYADPASVPQNTATGPTTLYWSTVNAGSVSFDGAGIPSGFYPPNGQGPTAQPLQVTGGESITMTAYIATPDRLLRAAHAQSAPVTVSQSIEILSVSETTIPISNTRPWNRVIVTNAGNAVVLELFGTNWLVNSKYVIVNLSTQQIQSFDLNEALSQYGPHNSNLWSYLSLDQSRIYAVVQTNAGNAGPSVFLIVAINSSTGAVENYVDLGGLSDIVWFPNVALSPDGQTLYFGFLADKGAYGLGGVWLLDPNTLAVRERYPWPAVNPPLEAAAFTFANIVGTSATGTKIYMEGMAGLGVLDTAGGLTVVSYLVIPEIIPNYGLSSSGVASRDGLRMYAVVGCLPSDQTQWKEAPVYLLVVDVDPVTFGLSVAAQITLAVTGGTAVHLALSADERYLYATAAPASMQIIDTSILTITTVGISGAPWDIVTTQTPQTIYCTFGSDLTIIDMAGKPHGRAGSNTDAGA